jgi:predicted transcriptional regulator
MGSHEKGGYAKKEQNHLHVLRQDARKKSLEYYIKEKEKQILEIIRVYGIKGGISHKQLAFIADLDRKSLRPYTERLVEKGLIKRGKGRQGKYLPTEEGYKDPLLNAYLLGNKFRFTLLNNEDIILNDRTAIDFVHKMEVDCSVFRRYYEPKFTDNDKLEQILFEFSNKIGAFITYVLIQAMNAESYNTILLPPKEQNILVKEWANKAISEIMPFLLFQFRGLVSRTFGQYGVVAKFDEKTQRFIFNKKTIDKLTNAFSLIYPRLNYELENMKENLPKAANAHKEFIYSMYQKWEKQKECEHTYGDPVMTLFGFYGRQCNKCHYIKKVKTPTSEMIKKRNE